MIQREMTTEEAIKQLDVIGIEAAHKDGKLPWSDDDTAALSHLISEARKVERVRKEFLAREPKGGTDKVQSGYEWAQDDVIYILNAPDTGGTE